MTSIYVHVASLEQPELRGFEELDGYGPQDRNTGQESEVPNTEKKHEYQTHLSNNDSCEPRHCRPCCFFQCPVSSLTQICGVYLHDVC